MIIINTNHKAITLTKVEKSTPSFCLMPSSNWSLLKIIDTSLIRRVLPVKRLMKEVRFY